VDCVRAAVVLDTAAASDLLRSLGGLFTASEETVEALRRGDRMGPEGLRLDEIPLEPEAPGWDGEGVARGSVRLVEDGRLVGLLTDLHSSRRFDLPPTGSARRPSFRDRPLAGPSRLVMSLGGSEVSHEELLGRLAPGLYVTTGRLVPAETGPGGAFVGAGIWLDGGRVVRPVRGAVIPFRPLGLLRSICGSDSPQAWTRGSECGCLLISSDIRPA
jgi:predicted Zn-dependent protease